MLLQRGATIDELNAVRRYVSAFKGGGLAAALRGPYATIVLSDVVGSPPHVIASGPMVPDPTPSEEVAEIARRFGIDLPYVDRQKAVVRDGSFVIAADGATAAEAVVAAGEAARHRMVLHTTELQGEAREVAAEVIGATEPGTIGVFVGETTVTVLGEGRGGRNQEAALAAARAIEGTTVRFVALGTDGIDGRSPAAGAMVDGQSWALMGAAGHDPVAALGANDSHTVLSAIDATITTGPTGTNVGDIWLVDRTAG
jgi:glycerate-2-kinase